MKGILKTEDGKCINVEIIKYDGTNKDLLIKRLNINSYINAYFKNINTYFIIPAHNEDDWFILNESQFNSIIDVTQ